VTAEARRLAAAAADEEKEDEESVSGYAALSEGTSARDGVD
jgi:hypothetical protein